MVVRAVLWDADGVLQKLPGFDRLWPFLPEDVRQSMLDRVFGSGMPDVLAGRIDMSERLEQALREHDLSGNDAAAVRATWSDLPEVAEARAVVAALRRQGVVCVLATNQDNLRETQMRQVYGPLMDGCYFSCSIGTAKPDPAFFTHIAGDLGLPAGDLLFIDDSEVNVEGARAAGLCAEHWHHDDGIGELEQILSAHGLVRVRSRQ